MSDCFWPFTLGNIYLLALTRNILFKDFTAWDLCVSPFLFTSTYNY